MWGLAIFFDSVFFFQLTRIIFKAKKNYWQGTLYF